MSDRDMEESVSEHSVGKSGQGGEGTTPASSEAGGEGGSVVVHLDAAAAAAPVADRVIPAESAALEVPTANEESASLEPMQEAAAVTEVSAAPDGTVTSTEDLGEIEVVGDVRAVLDDVIHAVEQKGKEASTRNEIASLMENVLQSVSRRIDGRRDVEVAAQAAAARSAVIGVVPQEAVGTPDGAGATVVVGGGVEGHDQGETMDEDAPRASGEEVNAAAADAVARVGDLEGAVADLGGGVGFDNAAATVEVDVGDEDGGQVTASPALPPADETGAAAAPVVARRPANGGGRERGGGGRGSWQRLILMGWVMAVVVEVFGFLLMVDSHVRLQPCYSSSFDPSAPLGVGECIEWKGGSRGLLRFLPGVKAKSRLVVVDGGGVYMGPDGVKVPVGDVLVESQTGGGLLCGVERFARKMAGVGDAPYAAKTIRSRLVFGAGTFCRTHSTPPPSSVFDRLRRGSAKFSDAGHLQVVTRSGKVLWTAANDVVAAGGRDVGVGKSSETKETGSRGMKGSDGTKKKKGGGRGGPAAARRRGEKPG